MIAKRTGFVSLGLMIGLGVCLFALAVLMPMPLAAQGIATNTPPPAPPTANAPMFATNTPPSEPAFISPNTPVPTAVIPQPPSAPLDNYALQLWLEGDVIELALDQIDALDTSDTDTQHAVQLTLYELGRRFPGAPNRPADLDSLIAAVLAAPIGTVDMRPLVHPYIEAALNQNGVTGDFSIGNFNVSVTSANLDGRAGQDAVLQITALANESAVVQYDEIVLATQNESGQYQILPIGYDLPAVPFGSTRLVRLQRVADVNRDGLDEAVIEVQDDGPGVHLYIVANRNNQATDLVMPGEEIRVGEFVDWPVSNPEISNPELSVIEVATVSESPDWPCLAQIPVTWTYTNNFYRPSTALNAQMANQDSLGCHLLAAEPILANEPNVAIDLLNSALEQYGFDVAGGRRALMVLAMAYTINGQLDDAMAIAQSVAPVGGGDSWIAQQSQALLNAIAVPSNTALDICEALVAASDAPACNTDAVLAFYFTRVTLSTEQDLAVQLNTVNLPVVEVVPLTELGRANRLAVQFDIIGASWWAFAPDARSQTYSAEISEPPAGFEVVQPRSTILEVPDSVYEALLVDDDPPTALNILDTLVANNPNASLTPEAMFIRALCYDLLGSRADARVTYYDIWSRYPLTLWGQLAGKHLELR